LITRQQEFSDTLAAQIPEAADRASLDLDRTPGVVNSGTFTDFTPGPIQQTGNPLHAALNKENQFFVVQTPNGEAYTRAGNFSMNSGGQIVTADGLPVVGDGGPITVAEGDVRISKNGSVSLDGEAIARLRVVEIDDLQQLSRDEGARFKLVEGSQAQPRQIEEPSLVPQSVEMPNVSVVDAMVEMISTNRAFEAYQKTVRTIDDLNERAIRTARTSG
jgi:flagellar basal body rod protein FlgG